MSYDVNKKQFDITLQIFMWQLKDNDLVGIAFIDTHIYIHSLTTIKNLIFAADILKSVNLYRYQGEQRVLSQVARVSTVVTMATTQLLE